MVSDAGQKIPRHDKACLVIGKVGNLVCPTMFDLGKNNRVVVVSVTEGDDKPLKYPYMFESANVCIINKIDLAPYLKSNPEMLKSNALKVNHHLTVFEVSAQEGTGMDKWCDFLLNEVK